MKSITKYQITDAQIRAAFIAAGIGGVSETEEISDGWYNSVYYAVDNNSNKYVMKIAPEKSVKVLTHERGIMASEVEFYRLLREKTGIKTPKIIYSDSSGGIIPTSYFIMEFLDGERLDKAKLTREERRKVKEKLAWILAEFHRLKGSGYGYAQTGLHNNWKDALTHMTGMLISDAASFNKKCRVGERLMSYIDKFADALNNAPCTLVNFDLHAMNIFCKNVNGEIQLSILDLERGFWGDPIGDFVSVEMFKPFNKKEIIALYNRYADVKIGKSREEQIRYYLLSAYLAAVMYTERFSRFKGISKFISPVYLAGTVACKLLALQAFSALKRLEKEG
jgi:aminoglycoside phosphotransferase (APT) family kinase protein